MGRTADSMVSAMMMDMWPSIGAIADFGITEANIGAYQRAIRSEKITADDLHKHVYDSKWLSEAIGAPVDTKMDFLLNYTEEEDDEADEDDEDGDDGEGGEEEFPDFSSMSDAEILAWITR